MARGEQLARQWQIIQLLTVSREGKTARELSMALGCHRRTVYRDLEALQEGGFPVFTDRGEDGRTRWALLDTAREPAPIPFRLSELMALYLGRDLLEPLRGTPFHEAMESLFAKVRSGLPEGTADALERLKAGFGVGAKPHKDHSRSGKTLETVQGAIYDRRRLAVEYRSMSRRKASRRRIDPYHLWLYDGSFYLIGWCHARRGVRTFAVDRIRACEPTGERFAMPEGFDAKDYMASSFGVFQGPPVTVRIRFAPSAAVYVRERTWHPSQRLSPEPDGSLLFEVDVADSDEIRSWVLGWGPNAEVLAPAGLRRAVRDAARATARRYSPEDGENGAG
jgi:predicted DNA-binding transcriptional regulator YafY